MDQLDNVTICNDFHFKKVKKKIQFFLSILSFNTLHLSWQSTSAFSVTCHHR